MFTLLTSSSNNKFPPEDAERAFLRKLGSTKIIRKFYLPYHKIAIYIYIV